MRRVLLGVVACALALGLATSAQAHPVRGPAPHRHVGYRPYYRDHGVRFKGGYYYRTYEHPVWCGRRWDPGLRCYVYLDPCLNVWYYYCPTYTCYLPVGYTCP